MTDVLRMKYQLHNGVSPDDAIVAAVPSISQENDLYLGRYPNGDWLYGDIVTALSNKAALEAALTNWQASFFADDDAAKTYVDGVIPEGTVLQPKLTYNAAAVNDITGLLEKTVTES